MSWHEEAHKEWGGNWAEERVYIVTQLWFNKQKEEKGKTFAEIMDATRNYYRLILPGLCKKDGYRQTGSFSGFFHSKRQPNVTRNYQMTFEHEPDFLKMAKEEQERGNVLENLDMKGMNAEKQDSIARKGIVEVRGIKEFFKLICYDSKTKKYTNGEIIPKLSERSWYIAQKRHEKAERDRLKSASTK